MEALTLASDLRAFYPRVLAKTLARTRSLADAEDAVQDAIERALASWPETGAPDSPEAWLVAVALNCERDRLRRGRREEKRADALAILAEMSGEGSASARGAGAWPGGDDLLRLVFACCDPSLETGESAALALATVLGLSNAEIACAFAVAPRSMDQRLTRARVPLRERSDGEAPRGEGARARLDAVIAVIRLLFNEGYGSTSDEAPIRSDLCRLALGLGRSLGEAFPGEPEVAGLLALMRLHEGRRPARLDANGDPVPLPDQDRSRWDREAIAEATALLEAALGAGAPGPIQIEAAISATHCRAAVAAETDWAQIAELYALLEGMRPGPSVRVNRAFAVARAWGAGDGLALLDAGDANVHRQPYEHLVRGALLEELGRWDEATASLERAAQVARNVHEERQIRARIDGIQAKRRS